MKRKHVALKDVSSGGSKQAHAVLRVCVFVSVARCVCLWLIYLL